MCPNRFVPLYQLALLLKNKGKVKEARSLAHHIMNKPIKIPSPTINRIKREMRKLLTMTIYEKE